MIERASGFRREATERLLLLVAVEQHLGTNNGWILLVGVLLAQYLHLLILIVISRMRAGTNLCVVLLCSLVMQLALPQHFFIVRRAVSSRSLQFAACVRIGLGLDPQVV